MTTMSQVFERGDGELPASGGAVPYKVDGSNFPAAGWNFDGSVVQAIYIPFQLINYGSGNITVDIYWYAQTATTGGVAYRGSLAAITPDVDTTSYEAKAFAAAQQVNDTHLGTTAKRVHKASLTLSNLDGAANGDLMVLKIDRNATDVTNDTLSGVVTILRVVVSYSDT